MSLHPCPGQSITPEPPPTLPGPPGEPFLLRGQQGLSPCSVPGTPSPHTASGSWASSPVRWGHAAGQGGEVHQGCVDRHRELRETRSPNVAICPEAQSGHTWQPSLDPEDAKPSDAHTQILGSVLGCYACTHTNPHSHTHTLTRARTPHGSLLPHATSFPQPRNVRSCPSGLNFFRGGARAPPRGWTGLGFQGWGAPPRGLLASLPPLRAPHLVNRGTARGCSRPRAGSPSRRPRQGTRAASCWLRGGRACAP